ncbi:MAG TPA: hypothetical protein VKT22_05645 [Steroidobacteraceae bacterium]|nr:hypothetical protein [Steroidobacteraceae bacterium]
MNLALVALVLASMASAARAGDLAATPLPVAPGPPTGLAGPAALRETVFGPRPEDIAPLPARVPLLELNVRTAWHRPLPAVFWFDARLRAWLSPQQHPAPLVIVIAGTGGSGNSDKVTTLRGALYGAGFHVLTLPSPTFPGFIAAASSTGIAGDLLQDGEDLYATLTEILAHLPPRMQVTDVDIIGYSLGGANAAIVKSIDSQEQRLHLHRAVMINPPVSLFDSVGRLDKLYAITLGNGDAGVERFYQRLYAELANLYRASDRSVLDEDFLLGAAASVLTTDREFAAAIALSFRLDLVNMFFAGDLYSGAGVVVDPRHPPKVGDSLEEIGIELRSMPFSAYFERVFAPYYLKHRAGSTVSSLIAQNRLSVIGDTLAKDGNYFAQTNRDDLILDEEELAWLERTLGRRIVVYEQGGHLGNLGERRQIEDLLEMLAGRWPGGSS